MATATYPGAAGNTAKTEADTFIPEIWSRMKSLPLIKRT